MRQLGTHGAGRKDYFLARYLPHSFGGGRYEIVRWSACGWLMRWGRTIHQRKTANRRYAANDPPIMSCSANSAGVRRELHTPAHTATWGI